MPCQKPIKWLASVRRIVGARIERCTHQDYLDILTELEDWGSDRTRSVHHQKFVHEYGDTAWVARGARRANRRSR